MASVILMPRFAHRATAIGGEVFDRLPDLLAALRPAVDIRTIDVAAASRNGVLVANAMPSFVTTTAEMVLALMLDLARSLGFALRPNPEQPTEILARIELQPSQ